MPAARLQKIIAAAGIASRRKAEELIASGRVTVNGQAVTELGTKADLEKDHIRVDGRLLKAPERFVYLMLNKPKGYVTTVSDPEGRPTVMDLVRGVSARVYPVGRLDYLSEGLLLLTNDGELAHRLTRAASHIPKTYVVKVSGRPSEQAIAKLRAGVRIGGATDPAGARARLKHVTTAPAEIRLARDAQNPWYEVTLIEGRNRQIRRMFEQVGHHVEKIRRVRYGALALDVPPGVCRRLAPEEVASLKGSGRVPRAKAVPQRASRPRLRPAARGTKDRAR